jgi:hypothetical protein
MPIKVNEVQIWRGVPVTNHPRLHCSGIRVVVFVFNFSPLGWRFVLPLVRFVLPSPPPAPKAG